MWIRTGSVEFSIHMVFKKETYSQRVPFSNKCLKSQFNHEYLAIFENGPQLKISSDIKPLLKRPFELGLMGSK